VWVFVTVILPTDVAGGQLKPLPSEFISHEARQLLNVSRLNREHSQLGASRLLVMPEKVIRRYIVTELDAYKLM
jgi:hypothetical protein